MKLGGSIMNLSIPEDCSHCSEPQTCFSWPLFQNEINPSENT